MLSTAELKCFIPTRYPERAKSFYGDVLGLPLLYEDKYALEFDADGTKLRINIVKDFTPHPFTVLGWKVLNIEKAIKNLAEKNVLFKKYDIIEQDELGIWTAPDGTKVAWFEDPDGNLLSLDENYIENTFE